MSITDIIISKYQARGTNSILSYGILAPILHPEEADFGFPNPISVVEYKLTSNLSSSFQISEIRLEPPQYQPKTPLGKKLLALRQQAIRRGLRLLAAEEIIQEVKRRRGELE